ncbi:MAG: MetQ/NlpA family ABC transporter substrate-binding protein [Lysobacter sp.]|nr:MetQ/NlpA family ABC transporter substrate-binding protein [Lysobacter sp.]
MKKFGLYAFALVALTACSAGDDAPLETLTVAATAVPHAEILDVVKPLLAKNGVKLEVQVYKDYAQPNDRVASKLIDVNYFQTAPFLEAYNREHGTRLTPVIGVHIEPLGAYSQRYESLKALPVGAVVAIPNEPSNNSRALILLHHAGVIELRDSDNPLALPGDVIANPRKLVLREYDSERLPELLEQVDLAVINTNYALEAGLDPIRDALTLERRESPYVNFLVARPDNLRDPKVLKLAAALTRPEVKVFIQTRYRGAVLPAF